MVEASRKHGTFDTPWPCARKDAADVIANRSASSRRGGGRSTRLGRFLQPLLGRAETARHGSPDDVWHEHAGTRMADNAGAAERRPEHVSAAVEPEPQRSGNGMLAGRVAADPR